MHEHREIESEALEQRDPKALASALTLKQQEVNDLQDENEDLEEEIKGLLGSRSRGWQLVILLLGIALYFAYDNYVDYRTTTKLENQYQRIYKEIEDQIYTQIDAAYQGDAEAHEQVIERLPVMSQRRLPRTLNESSGDSFVPIVEQAAEPAIEAGEEEAAELPSVPVYINAEEGSHVVGFLQDDADLISYNSKGDWSEIMLSTGFPAWVSADYVEMLENNLGNLIDAQRVRLRTEPNTTTSEVIGHLNAGDRFFVIENKDGWVKVRTPPKFRLWAKTSDIEALLDPSL